MLLDRQLLERTRARDERPPVTVVVGGCGAGRTERLRRVERDLGRRPRRSTSTSSAWRRRPSAATTRCAAQSPFSGGPADAPAGTRDAFDALLTFFMTARGRDGAPATFLLDEVLDVRTFESFPGLRAAQAELAPRRRAQPEHASCWRAASRRGRARLLGDRAGPLRRRARRAADVGAVQDTLGAGPARTTHRTSPTPSPCSSTATPATSAPSAASWRSCAAAAPPTPISAFAAAMAPDGELAAPLPLQLRAAAAPRPRLRRAEGDPRRAGDGGAADADRHRAASRSHAGLDQGLPDLAAGRRPRRLRSQALSLRRSAAAAVGPHQPRPARRPTRIAREVQATRRSVYAVERLPSPRPRPADERRAADDRQRSTAYEPA